VGFLRPKPPVEDMSNNIDDKIINTDDEIKQRYTAFRADPANLQFNDFYFCNINSITISRFKEIIDKNTEYGIETRGVTDAELSKCMGLLTRVCYEKALIRRLPVKSLEGLVNAIVNLMKQRQLETGKPTEILQIKDSELAGKSTEERTALLLGFLRRPNDN